MSMQSQASPHDVIRVGTAFSAVGCYLMLGTAGLVPMPETGGPSFIVFGAGLAFLFAGLTCFVRARNGLLHEQPVALHGRRPSLHRAAVIATAGTFVMIVAFAAIAARPRDIGLSLPFAHMQTTGETVGRTIVTLGTVIAWIVLIGWTVNAVRRLVR